jgi:hypothetical protein
MSTSSLESVVKIPKRLKAWAKLDDFEVPALLHRKFWGATIGYEEQAMDESGECMNKEEEIGNRLDKPVVENGRVAVSDVCDIVDDNEGQGDEGDDLIPGCRVLDLHLGMGRTLKYPRIFIRAEYVRIYDFLENHFGNALALHWRTPSAVVTGGSGVSELCLCCCYRRYH